ncbi:phosphoenolpyruvate--protein phosphotransferase [uncultured Limosilactobacillus sp.]|uniref:phosphoenolpyruvate--protein phosphotransferase n=1 Tax=uncultured Limosilactobacillus sp. TaxID=2837629 RepID=UPI0025DDDAD5|nr:phosphoenolpyruvate--protein phosphotransferase [uncultured Limosilactobacillus sp.]
MSRTLNGIAAGGGITIAPVYVMGASSLTAPHEVADDENHEAQRLRGSFSLVSQDLNQIGQQAEQELGRPIMTIETLQTVLNDRAIQQLAIDMLMENQWTAEWTVERLAERLQKLSTIAVSSPFWVGVIHDLSQRLLSKLLQQPIPDVANLDHRAVVIAHSISPTQVVRLDRQLVAALVTDAGGATSHFSLLSEELAIPSVVATHHVTKYAHNDMVAIVDGIHGKVILQPSPQEIDQYQKMAGQYAREHQALGKLKHQETRSTDGQRIRIAANMSLPDEINSIVHSGAEGVGLFRTEFMVMEDAKLASEDAQFAIYKKVATAMPERLIVVRTLDIGSDKLVQNTNYDEGDNPALGLRGIRLGLAHPELLRPQVRALLRAATYGKIAIMFPMVTTLAEFRAARAMVDEERQQLTATGVKIPANVPVGMMVETPAAVTMINQFAKYADFFSIGSNDLAQYLFAADRTNDKVTPLYQTLHPAMLRSVLHVIRQAHNEGKWVSLCGSMAAMHVAEPLLLAMDLDEFSVPGDHILPLRHLISGLSVRQLQPLLHQALDLTNADQVEQLVKRSLPELYQTD